MCKAPKPPAPRDPELDKPEFLRNRYLDAAIGGRGVIGQLRQGRSRFRVDLDAGVSLQGRNTAPTPPPEPARPPATAVGQGAGSSGTISPVTRKGGLIDDVR